MLALLLCCGLAACGAQVNLFGHTVSDGKPKQVPQAGEGEAVGQSGAGAAAAAKGQPAAPMVRDVLLSLNATVRKQVAGEREFDDARLHAMIAAELRQRGLMGPEDSTTGTPVDILIDGYSLQPTGNAAAGGVSHAGRLSGLVRVLDADGKEQRSFKVQAEAAVPASAQGAEASVLEGLYGKFAALTADGLAPKKSPPKK
jgi:hypothetical protein